MIAVIFQVWPTNGRKAGFAARECLRSELGQSGGIYIGGTIPEPC